MTEIIQVEVDLAVGDDTRAPDLRMLASLIHKAFGAYRKRSHGPNETFEIKEIRFDGHPLKVCTAKKGRE